MSSGPPGPPGLTRYAHPPRTPPPDRPIPDIVEQALVFRFGVASIPPAGRAQARNLLYVHGVEPADVAQVIRLSLGDGGSGRIAPMGWARLVWTIQESRYGDAARTLARPAPGPTSTPDERRALDSKSWKRRKARIAAMPDDEFARLKAIAVERAPNDYIRGWLERGGRGSNLLEIAVLRIVDGVNDIIGTDVR